MTEEVNPLDLDNTELKDIQLRARFRHLEHLGFYLPTEEQHLAQIAIKGVRKELDNRNIEVSPFLRRISILSAVEKPKRRRS
jgi:hypothetical protein